MAYNPSSLDKRIRDVVTAFPFTVGISVKEPYREVAHEKRLKEFFALCGCTVQMYPGPLSEMPAYHFEIPDEQSLEELMRAYKLPKNRDMVDSVLGVSTGKQEPVAASLQRRLRIY
ncbi:hypothetical protein HYS48_00515 [Candidatus Woesearchaeota archaeon]|nr:hypothetical protein [Candidatus Woesearchaeota archaeon]